MLPIFLLLQAAAVPAAPSPQPIPPFADGGYRARVQIAPDGTISQCRTEALGAVDPANADICPNFSNAAVLAQLLGQPVAPFRSVELTMRMVVAPSAAPASSSVPGDLRLQIASSDISVGPDGRVLTCTSTKVGDLLGHRMDLCVITRAADGSPDFGPTPGAPAVRRGTISFEITAHRR